MTFRTKPGDKTRMAQLLEEGPPEDEKKPDPSDEDGETGMEDGGAEDDPEAEEGEDGTEGDGGEEDDEEEAPETPPSNPQARKNWNDGCKAGRVAERKRIAAILCSDVAEGRSALAVHLAMGTSMSAKDACATLKASPKARAKTAKARAKEGPGSARAAGREGMRDALETAGAGLDVGGTPSGNKYLQAARANGRQIVGE